MAVNMSLKDVCRLCVSSENLVWIFDKRIQNSDNMKHVIFIMTGVEIVEKDTVSQKICSKCCQVTLEMFKFRCNAAKNDKELKAKCTELLNTNKQEVSLPTNVEIKQETVEEIPGEANNCMDESYISMSPMPAIHSSIGQLFKLYPEIKLPTSCLEYDVSAFVMLEPQTTIKQYLQKQRKRLKLLAHQSRPANDIRNFLIEIPNNSDNVRESSIKPPISQKAHLAKKKTTQVGTYQPNEESKKTVVSSNGGNVETINIPEPPMKIMRLNESKPRIKSSRPESSSSKNLVVQGMKPLSYTEEGNRIVEPAPLTSTSSNMSVTGDPTLTNTENMNKLYVCKICNSIHNSRKDLNVHQRKHIKCHICKRRLKSILERDTHLKECKNLNKRSELAEIQLSKVESVIEVQKKYPEIIKAIMIPEEIEKSKNSPLLPNVKQNVVLPSTNTKNDGNIGDMVDITEYDNLELFKPLTSPARPLITINNALQLGNTSTIKDTSNSLNAIPHIIPHSNSSAPDCTTSTTILLNINNSDISHQKTQMKEKRDSMEISSSNVGAKKSEINLSSKNIASNQVGSDIQVLKAVLKDLELKLTKEIPPDYTIHTDTQAKRCNFKSLKAKIQNYKLPVEICSGDVFSVKYNKPSSSSKVASRDHSWHDIRPIKFIAPPKSMPDLNLINGTSSLEQGGHNADDSSVASLPPLTANGNTAQSIVLPLKCPVESFNSNSVPAKSPTATATTNVLLPTQLPPYPFKPIIQNSALSISSSNILSNNVTPVYRTSLQYPLSKTENVTDATPSQRLTSNTAMPTNSILNGLIPVSVTNYNLNRNVNNYSFNCFPKKTNMQPSINISYSVNNSSANSLKDIITNTAPSIELNNNCKFQLTVTPQPTSQNIRNSVNNYRLNLISNPMACQNPVYAPSQLASTFTDGTTANQYNTVIIDTAKQFPGSATQCSIRVRNIAELT